MSEELAPRWSKGIAQWPLRRWISLTIAALVAVSAIAIAVGATAIAHLGEVRSELVDRTDPAVQEALRLEAALLDQETAVRGYLLAGRVEFLEPYSEGRQRQAEATTALRELLGGNADVAGGLDQVQREVDRWRFEYAEPIIIRLAMVPGPGEPNESDKARFDQVRAAVDGLQADLEATRVAGRERLGDASAQVVVVYVVIAAVLLVVFVLLTLVLRGAVAGPLTRLAAQARRVADGDYQQTLETGGPREIAELAGDVDSMRRRILSELAAQREANSELDLRTEDLKRSNAELEQFAYVASHDLQEPLRKVASFCQLLERRYKGQLDERADQYIGFAVDGAKRMQVLINDLLAFSRVGRHTKDHVDISAADLVAQARANLGEAIEETGARVEVVDELPTVRGETALLTAVFQNLISNAVKFRGEDPPHIRIECELRDGEWLFSITDNGIGIRPEFAERVFVIFQRLHAKEAYPGTGIGLAMCRKIIEYHGGRIWLDNDHTGGTRFQFTLPVPDTLDVPPPDGEAETPKEEEAS